LAKLKSIYFIDGRYSLYFVLNKAILEINKTIGGIAEKVIPKYNKLPSVNLVNRKIIINEIIDAIVFNKFENEGF
jgi:hypothetical protein